MKLFLNNLCLLRNSSDSILCQVFFHLLFSQDIHFSKSHCIVFEIIIDLDLNVPSSIVALIEYLAFFLIFLVQSFPFELYHLQSTQILLFLERSFVICHGLFFLHMFVDIDPIINVFVQASEVSVRFNFHLRAFHLLKVLKMRLNCLYLSLFFFTLHLLSCPEPIGKHVKFIIQFILTFFLMLINLLFKSAGIVKIILNHGFLKRLVSSVRGTKRRLSLEASGSLWPLSPKCSIVDLFSFSFLIIINFILNSISDLKQCFCVSANTFNLFLVNAVNVGLCTFGPLVASSFVDSISYFGQVVFVRLPAKPLMRLLFKLWIIINSLPSLIILFFLLILVKLICIIKIQSILFFFNRPFIYSIKVHLISLSNQLFVQTHFLHFFFFFFFGFINCFCLSTHKSGNWYAVLPGPMVSLIEYRLCLGRSSKRFCAATHRILIRIFHCFKLASRLPQVTTHFPW